MVVYLRDTKNHINYWQADIYNNDIHCYLYAQNYFDKLLMLFNSYDTNYNKWYNYIEYLDEYRGEIFEHKLAGKYITTEQIIEATLEDMKKVAEDLRLQVITD